MARGVRRAAVVGAGTMGAQIAAHLANVGIPVDLLDIAPQELLPVEAERGWTLEHPQVRNRLVTEAWNRARALRPSPFFTPEAANLVRLGNTSDHLDRLAEADWIVEAVVERMPVKRIVLEAIERHRTPGTLISSNTSGLSITEMSRGRSEEFRRHFCGTHFFNPPRYLHLLEVIPTVDTDPAVVEELTEIGESVLGKGVVLCRDTPYFIGNRIGCYAMALQLRVALEQGYSIDEVDAITGPALLRPRSATFRLADIVGVDLLVDVNENLYAAIPHDPEREIFRTPDAILEMVERGLRGEKSGAGFFKRMRGAAGSEILTLNLDDWSYQPRTQPRFASLDAARKLPTPAERLRAVVFGEDRASQYAWQVISGLLVYAADRAAEVSEDLGRIDDAMRWGWNWELGPFQQWDALGVAEVVRRLEAEGRPVPELARRVLEDGGSFYSGSGLLRPDGSRVPAGEGSSEILVLSDRKAAGKTVRAGEMASAIDLGDEVLGIEFHSKVNVLAPPVVELLRWAVEEANANWRAVVVGNQGRMFSAGADLSVMLADAEAGRWELIDQLIAEFQNTLMAVKCCRRPVVAAIFQQTLGGGCELALQCTRVQAQAETYVGLVETLVGLIPGGGGCKEMSLRAADSGRDLYATVYAAWQNIGLGKTSASAAEARALGYLRDIDGISVHPRRHLADARKLALSLAGPGYRPHRPRTDIPVLGEPALARMELELLLLQRAGRISEHDVRVAGAAALVLCGGRLTAARTVSEQYLLDLERQEFLSLCGEPRTRERIQHMLKTNRPLRN